MVHSKYFRGLDRSYEAVVHPFAVVAYRACGAEYKLSVLDRAGSPRTTHSC